MIRLAKHASWVCVSLCLSITAYAQDFTELSLEELMQIEVTSVSKKAEKLSHAAAAVYVVTQNEIRRSGATSIPEAMKLIPGVHVAQMNGNQWSVGMRGFGGRLANKLLVMIDGRSIYTPTYSGVFYENHEYMMDDIERIEVIRGPGATLWGTNAVNGVINIITKEVSDTLGGKVKVAAGNELKRLAAARYGAELSDNAQMRVYAKTHKQDGVVDIDGNDRDDSGEYFQSGFRMDWQQQSDRFLTLQGDIFDHELDQEVYAVDYSSPYLGQTVNDTADTYGGNLSARWSQVTGLDSEFSTHFYYDYYVRDEYKYSERVDTADLSAQYRFFPHKNNEFVLGGGYRRSLIDVESGAFATVDESDETLEIWNFFIQDTISFPEQNISLTIGSKFEDNSNSELEIQPNIRMSWYPTDSYTLWGAISRAARTPSRGETDFTINSAVRAPNSVIVVPQLVEINGTPDYSSEHVDAYELGTRWIPVERIAFDLAIYYNDYSDLRSYTMGDIEYTTINSVPFAVIPLTLSNNIDGYSYGSELLATWDVNDFSLYKLSYSYNKVSLQDSDNNALSDDLIALTEERAPKHQISLWASYDIAQNWELDVRIFYKSSQDWVLSRDGYSPVEAFTNADIRVGWQAKEWMELALVGKNVLHDSQQEFNSESWMLSTEMERSVYASVTVDW